MSFLKPFLASIGICLLWLLASLTLVTEDVPLEQFSSYNHSDLVDHMNVEPTLGNYDAVVRRAKLLMAQFGNIEIGNTGNYGAYSIINRNNFRRFIVYSPAFFDAARQSDSDSLAVLSICLHEMAHLASIHQLQRGYSAKMFEREADRTSGYYMYLAKATLEQAQSALNRVGDELETATHPGRAERLVEVKIGYDLAKGITTGDSNMVKPDSIQIPLSLSTQIALSSVVISTRSNKRFSYGISAKRFAHKAAAPTFELLGEKLIIDEKGRIKLFSNLQDIGYYSPASSGNEASLVIATTRYIIRRGRIYSGVSHAPAIPLGSIIK